MSSKQIGINNNTTKNIIRRYIRLLVKNKDNEEIENIISICKTTNAIEEYYTFIGNIYAQHNNFKYSIMYEKMALEELKHKYHDTDRRIVKSKKLISTYYRRL